MTKTTRVTASRPAGTQIACNPHAQVVNAPAIAPANDASTIQRALQCESFGPCLLDRRPGLTVPRLEGPDRRVDIRVHRTHGAVRLDDVLLVRVRCAVGKPRAHFVLGRDVVYPNPPGRRCPAGAIEAGFDVGSDAEDTIAGDWVAWVGDGWWRDP